MEDLTDVHDFLKGPSSMKVKDPRDAAPFFGGRPNSWNNALAVRAA